MRIVVGHANPDFDAYASTVAAARLFDGSLGVYLGSQNANVRAFHNLHEEFLPFTDLKGLELAKIDSVVMVDTRDPRRIGELSEVVTRADVEVVIYDHHRPQEGDLVGADDRSIDTGSTTSILVHELRRRGLDPPPLEASLYLLGIHEDTGSLTYPGTTAFDADAAAWLLARGADIEVLNQFLSRALDPAQRDLLEQFEESLEVWPINGQRIAVGVASADEYVDSASVLTHYVVEDLGYRAAIGIVSMPERLQVVARSRLAEVDMGAVMAHLGGGGHAQAASAGFRELSIPEALARVRGALEAEVRPPVTASDVMSSPVRSIGPEVSMRAAGDVMARWGHGGLPVVDGQILMGLVTRKDVDKALRHELDHAPVKGFMGRSVVTVGPEADLPELERLLASRGIGRVPVVEDGVMVGIVTRKDVLRAQHGSSYLEGGPFAGSPGAARRFKAGVEALLPPKARGVLEVLGQVAADQRVRAHVVGGFVRDMLIGRENLDIDIVVEGDGVAFGDAAAKALGIQARSHLRFGTAVLVVSKELHVDIASSRSEYYSRPGALPTVERSTLRQDLFRRDFAINAMAACLDPGCFGQVADPFGGLGDLDAGVVRVLHGLSFVEDPTRVLRAARFEVRYGFDMDADTEQHAVRAVELDLLSEVSGARVREELLDVLSEADPVSVLRRLDELGALAEILPVGGSGSAALYSVTEALVAADGLFEGATRLDRTGLLLAGLAGAGRRDGIERWIRHYRIGRDGARASLELSACGGTEKALADGRGMRDSRLVRMLQDLAPETIAILWARGSDVSRSRIERYVRTLAAIRPSVSGADLIALGAEPSEAFSAILARTRDDLVDGRAVGREAELANLRRRSVRAGLISSRKDPA
ncbi:MAG: CBS domain-containing protein [Coriobacteriia bacterium]|nr:CBS domain-containing protein [Coriobacteriia bacterium]